MDYLGSIGRSASYLVSSSVGSQLILLALSPLLARLYSPDEFALLGIYTAVITVFAGFCILRADVALFTLTPRHAAHLAIAGIIVSVALSLLLGILFCIGSMLAGVTFAVDTFVLSALVAIGLFGLSVFILLSSLAVRVGRYQTVGRLKVSQTIAGAAVQVGSAVVGLGAIGLLVGHLVTQSFGSVKLWSELSLARRWRSVSRRVLRYARVAFFGRLRRFTIYSAPSSIVNRIFANLPVVLVAAHYGLVAAGLLALALRTTSLPLLAVARGVTLTFQHSYAEATVFSRRQTTLLFVGALAAIGLPPTVALYLWAPGVFTVVFGDAWTEAGHYASLLAPAIFFQFVAYPLAQSLSLSGHHVLQFVWDVVRAVALLLGFLVMVLLALDERMAIVLLSGIISAAYAIQIVISISLSATRIARDNPQGEPQ